MKILRWLESLLWPALLLVVGLVIVQAHAIPYWQERAGAALGVVWSLGLEAAALWLLYQPGRRARAGGLLVALALVAVPLWQVTRPAIADLALARAQAAELRASDGSIAEARAAVAYYRDLADRRLGWQGKISEAEAGLADARGRRDTLTAALATRGNWRWAIELGPVALSLILFQAMNVVAIRTLARARWATALNPASGDRVHGELAVHPAGREPPAVPAPAVNSPPARELPSEQGLPADEFTVHRLQRAIRELVQASGGNAAEWCRVNSVHKRDLSYLFNHARLRAEGKRTLSPEKIAELAARFLASGESAQA